MAEISVIVPVYKVEEYLHRCVDSILNQTYTDFELVLVDDGSPDNCGKICDEYAEKDKRITVIHRENGGLSAARNTGIDWVNKNSNSKWIAFIDSDDYVSKYYLEVLIDIAEKNGVKVSVCDFDSKQIVNDNLCKYNAEIYSPENIWVSVLHGHAFAWNKLYSIDFFRELRYPEGRLYEDTATTHKILFTCDRIAYADIKLYFYYINPESITNKKWSPKKTDSLVSTREQMKFFRDNNFPKAYGISFSKYNNYLQYNIESIEKEHKADKSLRDLGKKLNSELRSNLIFHSGEIDRNICNMSKLYGCAFPHLHKTGLYIRKKKNNISEVIFSHKKGK